MLKIRPSQMEAFQKSAQSNFEDRMIIHIEQFFPTQFAELGQAGARRTVRSGIQYAAKYGIVSERDVCKYIDVMLTFGDHFDTSRDTAWARRILNNPEQADPTEKAVELLYSALEHASK